MSKQENAAPCTVCGTGLGRRRDRVPMGLAHPGCAAEYRRRYAGRVDHDTRLPKHLRSA